MAAPCRRSIRGQRYTLQLWDEIGRYERWKPGQRFPHPRHYRGAAVVLVFFDVGDMSSFERVKHWVDAAIESCLSHACSRTTVVLVVGHKADLATTGQSGGVATAGYNPRRVVSREQAEDAVQAMDEANTRSKLEATGKPDYEPVAAVAAILYAEASAKTGMGVEEAVATAVDMHRRELRAHEPPMKPGWWRPGVGPEPEPEPEPDTRCVVQ